jgi:hypothetical protein
LATYQKIVRAGGLHKGRPAAPTTRDATAALQHSTRLALARAKDAVAKHDRAKLAGDRLEIARARGEALAAQTNLERANVTEKALAAMRATLAKPLRIA